MAGAQRIKARRGHPAILQIGKVFLDGVDHDLAGTCAGFRGKFPNALLKFGRKRNCIAKGNHARNIG